MKNIRNFLAVKFSVYLNKHVFVMLCYAGFRLNNSMYFSSNFHVAKQFYSIAYDGNKFKAYRHKLMVETKPNGIYKIKT